MSIMANKGILTIVSSFIIFVFALGMIFLRDEKLSMEKTVNIEKLTNFFVSIGSIAAPISLFFLYRQIQSIQEDRNAGIQPHLYPAITSFEVTEDQGLMHRRPIVVPVR